MQKTKVFLREKQEYVSIPINPEFAELADDLMLQKWQKMINLAAEILAVKAGLIMRVTEDNMEIFLRSESEGNPYPSDGKDHLGHGLYCETVLGENRTLYIDNSLHNDIWKDNPDVKLQMISYYGLPIKNPDGSFFGTICALDNKTMVDSQKYRDLLDQFCHTIETDLYLAMNMRKMSELLQFLALETEASGSFVQVSDNKSFDQAVKNVLASFGIFFAVDRSGLFRCSEDYSVITASHEWHEPASKENRGYVEHPPLDNLPWLKTRLLKLQPVEITEVKALSAEAEAEKSYFLAQGIQSLIYLPLSDNQDKLKGFMRFDAVRSLRTWPEEQVRMLQVLAEIVGNALLRIEAEEEVRVLNEELEQRVHERTAELEASNKELESFAYSISHDLRAPLRAINGFSFELNKDYYDQIGDQGKHYLDRIMKASARMGQLIDDLLQISRVTRVAINPEQVDLSEMALKIAEKLTALDPDRKITWKVAANINVRGDIKLLYLVMEQLLHNAWKFSSNKEETIIEFGQQLQESEKVYFVSDNGVGFNMAYASKLFGIFQRLHGVNEFPGTGIGLATVQRIINLHGGRIWAESEEGKGANFFFTLGRETK